MVHSNSSLQNNISFIIVLLFLVTKSLAQVSAPIALLDWYDSKIGKENLDINNGKLLLNYDVSIVGNTRFAFDNYYLGIVNYDNQFYNKIYINYDVLKDQLIVKINNENDSPIVLTKEKVAFFYVQNKKFTNLNFNNPTIPEFVSGFCEEKVINSNTVLFIKYTKNRIDLIVDNKILDDYNNKISYIVKFKEQFYEVNSKKNVVAIFPSLKKLINDYYDDNEIVEKSDKIKFLSNLLQNLTTMIK